MLLVVADCEIVFPHELELHDATTLSVEGTAGMTTLSGDGLVTLFVVREGSKLSLWDLTLARCGGASSMGRYGG